MPKQLIVIGAATPTIIRVIDDLNELGDGDFQIVGFLDNAFARLGSHFKGFAILGGFEAIEKYDANRVVLINTIARSIESCVQTTEYFMARGYRFTNIVHPSGLEIRQARDRKSGLRECADSLVCRDRHLL